MKVEFLIGRGSRLPSILEKIQAPENNIQVTFVVSHKKPADGQEDVIGITEAKKLGIPTLYFNLAQMRQIRKTLEETTDETGYRASWQRILAETLLQQYYKPDLVLLSGWDIVLDHNFLEPFQKENIPVLNVHPHPLPDTNEPQDVITAPDDSQIPVLRGMEVWAEAINKGLKWSGVTMHHIIPDSYDTGKVVAREWVKIEENDTVETLREKLNKLEDELVPNTLLKLAA